MDRALYAAASGMAAQQRNLAIATSSNSDFLFIWKTGHPATELP